MKSIFMLLNPFIFLPIALLLLIFFLENREYKKTSYYKITKYPLLAVRLNIGRNGEYLTYKCLRNYEEQGAKFLFNVYVPKANGETSEIDVMMIHKKGIFVFESKNYSGWIFGNETQKMWTQVLPAGKGHSHKESFYNPILQNQSHIKHLKTFLGETIEMKSIIVFSERCTFKNVQVKNDDFYVIKRNNITHVVNTICNSIQADVLNDNDICKIYDRLYPFTQVDAAAKEQHINNIKKKQHATGTENTSKEKAPIPTTVSPVTSEPDILTCPRCDGKLLLRTAAKGANAGRQFYGCSNFPKCRYIQNIT